MDRYSQLGVCAALEAWRDAGLAERAAEDRSDWGVAWGTGMGGALTFDAALTLDWPGLLRAQRLAIPGGTELCARLTRLGPVVSAGPVAGWSR